LLSRRRESLFDLDTQVKPLGSLLPGHVVAAPCLRRAEARWRPLEWRLRILLFSSGNLVLDLLHNFFLENGARKQKLRVYEMTDHPVTRAMIGYPLVRSEVYALTYGKAHAPPSASSEHPVARSALAYRFSSRWLGDRGFFQSFGSADMPGALGACVSTTEIRSTLPSVGLGASVRGTHGVLIGPNPMTHKSC